MLKFAGRVVLVTRLHSVGTNPPPSPRAVVVKFTNTAPAAPELGAVVIKTVRHRNRISHMSIRGGRRRVDVILASNSWGISYRFSASVKVPTKNQRNYRGHKIETHVATNLTYAHWANDLIVSIDIP